MNPVINNVNTPLALGELLNDIRKEKKISTKTIFATGITRPTYYRFVRGEGEISLTNFLKIIDILGIELTEFEEVIPLIKQGSKILENQLAEALATFDYLEIAKIKTQALDQFVKTDGLGYQYVYWRAGLIHSKFIGDCQEYETLIQQVKTYLNGIDLWTNIELKLFSSITETLNFEEYDYFFKRFLYRRTNHEEVLDPLVLDLLYFGYYETALDSCRKSNVTIATTFILKRTPHRFNYRFRIWRLFLYAAKLTLNGEFERGKKKYTRLQKIIAYVFRDEQKGVFEIKTLHTLWEKVEVIAQMSE